VREAVTQPRDYFVSVDGDEANSGTDPGSPWPIRYAIEHVAHNLEIQNARVTIHAAEPPVGQCYPQIVLPAWHGTCNVDPGADFTVPSLIGGTPTTMHAYRIGSTGAALPFAILCIMNPQPWFVSGFAPNSYGGQAILADARAKLYLGDTLHFDPGTRVSAINNSFVEFLRGSIQYISGNAQRFVSAMDPGSQVIAQNGDGVTGAAAIWMLPDGPHWPNFSHCFAYARGPAQVNFDLAYFNGTATGLRKQEQLGGCVMMPPGVLPNLS
jgi:hypothetical protein